MAAILAVSSGRPMSALLGCAVRNCGLMGRQTLVRVAATAVCSQRCMSSSDSGDIPREGIPISRFPVPEQSSLPQDVQDRMNGFAEKTGFMPNVFQTLSYRPAEFTAFVDYYEALMDKDTGSLTKAERELIVVSTSAVNNCLYCVVSHSAFHRLFSKNPYVADQVATNPEFANLTPREKAIVKFAIDVCKMEPIEDADFESLEQHGLSRDDIWDVGAIAAFFSMSNRMAHLTAMRPNEEFYLMGRVPRQK